ncbi:helix-turn-helix transcriptional regulator [Massilibacterium senegalense]|uniref:helix-turn-helix transcriptional regulator n=1 Tax=Massilibacterium senegalense TaxID=1632858 RepID=UPI000780469B|nr:helix-turn-helix transcriptional regulator [Massilibacterium senegalense]
MRRVKLVQLRGNESQRKISSKLGITPQMLGAIERGERTPSLGLAKKIADYYDSSIEELFFDENETNCV